MGKDEQGIIADYMQDSEGAMQKFAASPEITNTIILFVDIIAHSMANGGKLLIAGNGGSAADAQHIAGEFISRLFFDHEPLPALALTTDSSVITATGNDYGYENIFERQILGLGQKGDVFLGISTSGTSPNILKGFGAAQKRGVISLGFTGAQMGPMTELCESILQVPSVKTSIIQQLHIVAAHLICGLVENRLCGPKA